MKQQKESTGVRLAASKGHIERHHEYRLLPPQTGIEAEEAETVRLL